MAVTADKGMEIFYPSDFDEQENRLWRNG